MPDEGFWASRPTSGDPVVNGRYRLPDPVTGEDRSWTRASNYGYVIADQYGLTRWRHRQILKGIRMRPDLQQLVSVLDPDDTAKQDEIIGTALEVAGSTTDANLGAAIHEALAVADKGGTWPDWADKYVQGYRAELARHGLEVVLVERLLINQDRESAGKTDRVYRTADGRYVIGDVKSTGRLHLQAGEIAVQVENYGGAGYLQADDGTWRALDWPIDRDQAVIVHIDRDTGACAVYQLVMPLARYGTNLAQQVRAWHRMTRDLLVPYVRPSQATPPAVTPTVTLSPTAGDERTQRWEEVANASEIPGTTRHLQAVPDRVQHYYPDGSSTFTDRDPNAEPHVVVQEPDQEVVAGQLVNVDAPMVSTFSGLKPLKTQDQLMKLTKAQVQQYGRERGVTDLTHNKPQLMPIFAKAGILADGQALVDQPIGTMAPAGPPAPTEDPDDPKTVAFRTLALGRIRSAKTVGELGTYHQSVVRQYGDLAWSDELTEAARERVEFLDSNTAAAPNPAQVILTKIVECRSQQALAELWEEVTLGGSVPDRWGEPVQRAANERMEQIRLAAPPAPSNPFSGGTS